MPRISCKRRCSGRAGRSRRSATARRGADGCGSILTNVWRDRLRKESRGPIEVSLDDAEGFSLYRTLVEEDPFPYSDTLHVDFLDSFCEDDVHTVLQRLPARYRAPLVLRYMERVLDQADRRCARAAAGHGALPAPQGSQALRAGPVENATESGALSTTVAGRGDVPWNR